MFLLGDLAQRKRPVAIFANKLNNIIYSSAIRGVIETIGIFFSFSLK